MFETWGQSRGIRIALRLAVVTAVPAVHFVFTGSYFFTFVILLFSLFSSLLAACLVLALALVFIVVGPIEGGPPLIDMFAVGCAVIAGGLFGLRRLGPDAAAYTPPRYLGRRLPAIRWLLLLCMVATATLWFFRSVHLATSISWFIALLLLFLALPAPGAFWRTADWGSAVLLVVSIIMSVAVLEVGSRFMLTPAVAPSDIFMPDPDAIFTLRPGGASQIVLYDNKRALISEPALISQQGIRDDRVYLDKKDDEYRIVFLGDSYTFGHGLTVKETIPRMTEDAMNARGLTKTITGINCGVKAYAPWQERFFLIKRGLGFDPDLVVLQLFPSNDVAGSLSREGKLLRAIDVQWERRLLFYRRQNEFPIMAERWLQTNSPLYATCALMTKDEAIVLPLMEDFRFGPAYEYPRVVPRSTRPNLREVCLSKWYPELEEAWRLYCDDIRAIHAECKKRNIGLVAFVHSDPISLFPDAWTMYQKSNPEVRYVVNKDITLSQRFLAAEGIPYVDVTAKLQQLTVEERSEVFYNYDGHFSPDGAERIAQMLADYLVDEYLPRETDWVEAPKRLNPVDPR